MNTSVAQRPQLDAVITTINSVCDVDGSYGFRVNDVHNKPGQNLGSLAILGFAQIMKIGNLGRILLMFCEALTEIGDDRNNEGKNHYNLRALAEYGMEKIFIDCRACTLKPDFQDHDKLIDHLKDLASKSEDENGMIAIGRILSALRD